MKFKKLDARTWESVGCNPQGFDSVITKEGSGYILDVFKGSDPDKAHIATVPNDTLSEAKQDAENWK